MPLWLREYFHKSSIRAPLLYETRRYTNYKLQDNVYVTAFNTLQYGIPRKDRLHKRKPKGGPNKRENPEISVKMAWTCTWIKGTSLYKESKC